MGRNTLGVVTVVIVLLVAAFMAQPARGQDSRGGDLTTAILVEMRGLRVAIEQLASSNARIQLAIGRLQIQEQRVNVLLRQHLEIRQKLADAERQQTEAEARLADMLDVVGGISDPPERQAFTQEIGVLRQTVSAGSVALQRMRTDESEIAGLVSAEQGRWTTINQELDALDQALRRP